MGNFNSIVRYKNINNQAAISAKLTAVKAALNRFTTDRQI
jgi:hypothetical protein